MNTFNHKNISVALLLTLSTLFSFNTHAVETPSIESSITELVVAQGQQMMNELSEQLQQSISAEISSFTIDFPFNKSITDSLAWVSEEQQPSIDSENENSAAVSK